MENLNLEELNLTEDEAWMLIDRAITCKKKYCTRNGYIFMQPSYPSFHYAPFYEKNGKLYLELSNCYGTVCKYLVDENKMRLKMIH